MRSSLVLEVINMNPILTTITPHEDTKFECQNIGLSTVTF